jgi:hypothetical protein
MKVKRGGKKLAGDSNPEPVNLLVKNDSLTTDVDEGIQVR